MSDVSTDQLKQAVESQHGGRAYFVQSVPVHEERGGETIWDGPIAIFDLWDTPSGATRAYAWSYELSDGRRQYFAVLHQHPVTGPIEAIRATIVAEARAGK